MNHKRSRTGVLSVLPLTDQYSVSETQTHETPDGGKRQNFSLPIAPEGTAFQKKVWKALQNIPYGQTRSYGEIAKEIGQCHAARAVGNANHNNPIAIVIPCHRVIGANGKLTGYYSGIDKKEFLLKLEGALI